VHQYFGKTLFAWRYDPPLSVGNNGRRENILVWQGNGLYGESSEFPCGSPFALMYVVPHRTERIALVLTADGSAIDEPRTKELFGLPEYGFIKHYPGYPPLFHPLGREIGFFEYRGLTYMDTFGDTMGLAEPPPTPKPAPASLSIALNSDAVANTLTILLRSNGRTRPVCLYRMTITEKPR
jgi:hypothetical protein